MPSGALPEELVLAHRITGYLAAFVLAPFVLSVFARPGRHRPWGQVFLGVMVLLYASGLYFTFARHAPGSFVWARNLAFNFVGFFFVLLGWRAIWRMRHARLEPSALDHAMRALLIAASVALVTLGVRHHFPSFAVGALGLWLALAVFREVPDARALYRRHQRCMLAAFFYVLTVLSLVHVRGLGDLKWLWPTLIGIPLAVYATRGDAPSVPRMRRVVWGALGATFAFGAYILASGALFSSTTALGQ